MRPSAVQRKPTKTYCTMKTLSAIFCFLMATAAQAQTAYTDINTLIDNWHIAAAKADASTFFQTMGDHCIYIGTDASERWTKTEFITFAKPYFDKGKAWDFKPYDRDLHVTNNGKIAWFS